MKKTTVFKALFSCFTTSRAATGTKGGRDKSPARKLLRLESLEERQLLSVNPTTPIELQSETLIVDTTSDVVDSSDEFLSLREAIAAAQTGDVVTFDSSLNGETITLAGSQLEISTGIVIDASSLSNGITIDANQTSRVFNISGGTEAVPVQLKNLAVTGGKIADSTGSGITNSGTLTLTDCTVSENSAGYGGGGIYNDSNATLTLTNCTISGNSATSGGGILNQNSVLTLLTNCTITGNSATSSGGGICGSGTLTNCTISGNSAAYGGGIGGSGTLTNCTVSGNSASSNGGGILNFNNGMLTLTNSTVSGNSASSGSGIYNGARYDNNGTTKLYNTIVAVNRGSDIYLNGGTITGYNSLSSYAGLGYTYDATLPLFTDAANGDYTLIANSQAIDKGNNGYVAGVSTDLAGNARIVNNVVDLGAYEYQMLQLATPTIISTSSSSDSITINWNENADAVGYWVYYKPSDSQSFTTVWVGAKTTYTLNDLPLSVSYDFKVKAKGDGVSHTNSDESAVVTVMTEAPSLVVNTAADVVAGDGKTSLREAIAAAQTGDTITFDAALNGQKIVLAGTQLEITQGITIDASALSDGITIDANQTSRVFNISGGTEENPVQFKNLTVTGGKVWHANGGGICNTSGTLTLTNCTVSGNSALSNTDHTSCQGGGIYNSGTLTLTNCTVSNNYTTTYTDPNYGGGIYNSGTATLTNCTVSNNYVKSGNNSNLGGGIYNSGTLTLTNCTVAGNSANNSYAYGGGIYQENTGTITLYNTIVAINTAWKGSDIYSNGGVVTGYSSLSSFTGLGYTYDATLPLFTDAANGDYTLSWNSQAIDKGDNAYAVYPDGSAIKFDLAGKRRIDNHIVDLGAYEYLSQLQTPVISSTSSNTNSITLNWRPVSNAKGYWVYYKKASETTYTTAWAGQTKTFTLSDLAAGEAYHLKIKARGDETTHTNSDETAVVYAATFLTEPIGEPEQPSTVVSTNKDVIDPGDGVISLREALAYAGTGGLGNVVSFQPSLIGATITLNGAPLTINSPTTINAVAVGGSKITIDAGGKSNVFKISGGTDDSPVLLNNLVLTGGKTAWYGGLVETSGTTVIRNVDFNNGFGYYGGAVANNGNLSLVSCDFVGNKAAQGGAIYNRANGVLTVEQIRAEGNSATNFGGVLYNNGTTTVTDGEFVGNSSNNCGGAIYVKTGSVSVDFAVFSENTARNYGGAVYNLKNFDVSNGSMIGNSSIYGGGIANFGELNVDSVDFYGNGAERFGGGIYHSSSTAANVVYGSFCINSAYDGGGLYVRIGTVRLTGVYMTENSAAHNGSAIYNKNQVVLTECHIENNAATYYGGGIYNEKIVRMDKSTFVSGNWTNSGKSPDIHNKEGGQVIVSSELPDSVFDEEDDWLIEL